MAVSTSMRHAISTLEQRRRWLVSMESRVVSTLKASAPFCPAHISDSSDSQFNNTEWGDRMRNVYAIAKECREELKKEIAEIDEALSSLKSIAKKGEEENVADTST